MAEGEPSTPALFRGLFYSWPVAPQQSRLRFKQPPKLSPFFPFVCSAGLLLSAAGGNTGKGAGGGALVGAILHQGAFGGAFQGAIRRFSRAGKAEQRTTGHQGGSAQHQHFLFHTKKS